MDLWHQILRRLEPRISRESYENWLEPVQFQRLDGQRTLWLAAPNPSAKEWLEAEYAGLILETAKDLGVNVTSIAFETETQPMELSMHPASRAVQTAFDFNEASNAFNPKYTFDSFVVGSCNELAHAAARAVAANPARSYNPLYIYGGVGMGKTHLMHAIGAKLQASFENLQVIYISSEEFMNEMINSLRYDRMSSFHRRFRSADVLLVDDIQVLGSKERTQEEFFHTFNALHNQQKQIIISSDSPPKDVPGLVERLQSRFQWGLMADIQPPDLETKMAILDRKAEEASVNLPDEVRIFLATRMKANFRELEGALTRLAAISSLSETEISVSMAKQTLQWMTTTMERKVTIRAIQDAVGEEFGLQVSELCEKSNARAITVPRQIAMYLAKELTRASFPEIGRAFGGKHHTTVLHAVNKIERLRQSSPNINTQIHRLSSRFN